MRARSTGEEIRQHITVFPPRESRRSMKLARPPTGIEEFTKWLEARLKAGTTAVSRLLKPMTVNGGVGNKCPLRQVFMAAAMRLSDGDPWKEKVTKELKVSTTK